MARAIWKGVLRVGGGRVPVRLLSAVEDRAVHFVVRDREYVIAIFAERGLLRAETLRFADEIRTPEDVGVGGGRRPAARAVAVFARVIRSRARGRFDPEELADRYAERVAALARDRRRRGEGVVEVRAPEETREEVDLLAAIRATLRPSGRRAASTRRRSGARRRGRSTKRRRGAA
jgi:DNA end-binding protein Ku